MNSFSGSLAGAVDLSGLQNKSATPKAPAAGQKIPGEWIVEVTQSNLSAVLSTSTQVPVVLAFHTAQASNSEKLLTLLRRLISDYAGRLQLGIVDCEKEREVAAAFGVEALPAVAALLQGQPIPLFTGSPEEADIALTLEKLLEAAAQYGITGVLDGENTAPAAPEVPPLHQEGQAALAANDLPAARRAYHAALKENPRDAVAKSALAQVDLLERIQALNPLGEPSGLQQILEKANAAPAADINSHLAAADVEVAIGRPEAAFARLLDRIADNTAESREELRKRLLELFMVVGSEDPTVKQARRELTNLLF